MADLVLDWGLFGTYGTSMGASQTVDTGGIAVTVDFEQTDENAQAFTFNAEGYVGPGDPFSAFSFLKLWGDGGEGGIDDTSTTTISFASSDDLFSDQVQNVSFRINDIDVGRNDPGDESPNHIDILTITAFDAAGNEVPVTITQGSDTDPFGTSGTQGGDEAWQVTDGQASVLVSIDGPVSRVEIDYNNGEDGAQLVTVSDIHFSTIDADGGLDYIVEGDDGDDLIDIDYTGDPEGDRIDNNDMIDGSNDDVVEAGGGNDTVRSGEGSDTVDGGDGNDDIDTRGSTPPAIDVPTFPGVPVDADPENERDLVYGGEGDDTITTGDDRDTIEGGAGDDVINPGIDNDSVLGGDGNDYINDVQGADYIDGGAGDDTIIAGIDTFSDYVGDDPNLPIGSITSDPNTTDGMDTVFGGDGNDSIMTGDDADYIEGGAGMDTIHGGIDDDTILGGTEDDSITGGHGSDSILAGDGDDWVNAGDSALLWGQEPDETDPVPENGRDFVDGGAGNDTIFGQDDDDTLLGGDGDDMIDGGIDEDELQGGAGNDTLVGGHGSDIGLGGDGNDVIDLSGPDPIPDATDPLPGNDRDYAEGGAGNDTITTGDDDDTVLGGDGDDMIDTGIDEDLVDAGAGNDTVLAGDGDDTVSGGIGNDMIDGGAGDDSLMGGDGRDTFVNVNPGDFIDGGDGPVDDGPDDYDTLDLRGSAAPGGGLEVTYTSADRQDGFVTYRDADGNVTGTLNFLEIENVVPCFTPGTAIATPKGERLVEELREGDKIITRDNGIQEIRWIGTRTLTGHELARAPHLRPILIQKGSLGDNLPEHDILVSPQHRLLLTGDKTQLYFEETEVLAAAKHLTGMPGIDEVGTLGVTYVHFMFDRHEVVLSNGAWTESFQPGANVLDGLGAAQRDEIFELFPGLKTREGLEDYAAARRSLRKHEARLLTQ